MSGRQAAHPYWELHVTISTDGLPGIITASNQGTPSMEKLRQDIEDLGWTHSYIAHDPILGPGNKAYATIHLNRRVSLQEAADSVMDMGYKLRALGYTVLREKVENVLVDIRYS